MENTPFTSKIETKGFSSDSGSLSFSALYNIHNVPCISTSDWQMIPHTTFCKHTRL